MGSSLNCNLFFSIIEAALEVEEFYSFSSLGPIVLDIVCKSSSIRGFFDFVDFVWLTGTTNRLCNVSLST